MGKGPRVRLPRDGGPEPSLLSALDERYSVVGSVEPHHGRLAWYRSVVRGIHPRRDAWRNRAGLSPSVFRALTDDAIRKLASLETPRDLIILMQTLFSLGPASATEPYVVFTDNIYSLTARFYPAWAPLGRTESAERIRLEREVCLAARYVFATSDFLRDGLLEDYGCEPSRVVKVGLGANVLGPMPDHSSRNSAAALFVGIDFRRKGGHVLLQAWPQVVAALPDAELWIVGPKGREPSGARQRGVRWHGVVDDRAALSRLYGRAQAFVLPSLFEPFGRVLFEAMGSGLPCIVTDRGGIAEGVDPGVDGLVVQTGNPESLAEALISLLGDPQRARRMGLAAREKVFDRYTWADVAARMAPHLEEAARAGSAAEPVPTDRTGDNPAQ